MMNISKEAAALKTSLILKLLRNHRWNSGFNSPFADPDNKALEEKLEEIQRNKLSLQRDLEVVGEQFDDLKTHVNNLQVDIQLTQGMYTARKRHLDQETTIYAQAERSYKHSIRDNKRMENEMKTLQYRNRQNLMVIQNRKQIVDEKMRLIESDKDLIKNIKQKQKDMKKSRKEIAKYESYDRQDVKQMAKDFVSMEKRNMELKHTLQMRSLDTSKASDQYRRLCLEFRFIHSKREEMLLLWNTTITGIKYRDVELRHIAAEYYQIRKEVIQETNTHDCLEAFFDQRVLEVDEIEHKLRFYEMEIRNWNEKLEKVNGYLSAFQTDHTFITTTIENLTLRNCSNRERKKTITAELSETIDIQDVLQQELILLKENREKIVALANNHGSLLKELDNIIYAEEDVRKKVDKLGIRIRNLIFDKTNEKVKLVEDIRLVKTRINRVNRIFNVLRSKEYENMSKMSKGQSRHYRADLEISNVEIKVSRIITSTIEPKYFALQVRRERLIAKNRHMTNSNAFVTKEIERIKLNFRATSEEILVQHSNAKDYDVVVDEARLDLDDVHRLHESLTMNVKQLKCDFSMVKLAKSRLGKSVATYNGGIFNMKHVRRTYEMVTMERKNDLELYSSVVARQAFLMKKELVYIEGCLNHTNIVNAKFKGKFELLSGIRLDQTIDDPCHGRTLFCAMKDLIKERVKLKKQVFEWQRCLDEDEKDLEGLRNVLEIVKISNNAFRHTLHPVSKNGTGITERREVEDIQKKVMVFRNRCKRLVEKLTTKAEFLNKELGVTLTELQNAKTRATDKLHQVSRSESEIQQLKDRIGRWDQLLSRSTKELEAWEDQGIMVHVHNELIMKLLEAKYEHAMRKMLSLMKMDPKIRKAIYIFLRNNDMLVQFLDRIRLTERKLFEQYCEMNGEYGDVEECGIPENFQE